MYQDWIDLNHVIATARAQVFVDYGKHIKPWVNAWTGQNRLTTANNQCDANKFDKWTFKIQRDTFNGRFQRKVDKELEKFIANGKFNNPEFSQGMCSFKSKVDAAERYDEKLMRNGANVVGPRLRKAVDSHFQR